MNLLPGVREVRTPLAAGYMWIITAWLWLAEFRLLPQDRPLGSGWDAQAWDIGTALGKTALLAILTFVAYLFGSFVEIDPNNSRLQNLAPYLTRKRPSKCRLLGR